MKKICVTQKDHVVLQKRDKDEFRKEVLQKAISWRKSEKQISYDYDGLLKQAIEKQFLPSSRQVARQICEPWFAKQKVKQEQFKETVSTRLQESYGCCPICTADLLDFVLNTKKPRVKVSKNGVIEWGCPI